MSEKLVSLVLCASCRRVTTVNMLKSKSVEHDNFDRIVGEDVTQTLKKEHKKKHVII